MFKNERITWISNYLYSRQYETTCDVYEEFLMAWGNAYGVNSKGEYEIVYNIYS